ncbi:hypothetical protein [Promicromonospora sp. NFX87]|uniref:hypothetical protein n=1 Tax=Promicromonospora sp. NFX87 TaxID=3402691 RepID=UPI003AFB3439
MKGFVLWHKITLTPAGPPAGALAAVASAFGLGLPLTISNSVYGLGLVLDADVKITAQEGANATAFTVTVYDVPEKTVGLIEAETSKDKKGSLRAEISLGYLDKFLYTWAGKPVLRGRVTSVEPEIGDDGRHRLVLKGQEETGYLLLKATATAKLDGSGNLDDLVRKLLADVPATATGGIRLAPGSTLGTTTKDFTVRSGSVLSALAQLTEQAGKALVVGDGVVAIGPAVGTQKAPVELLAAENLVQLGTVQKEEKKDDPAAGEEATELVKKGTVTVLGHPGLRVGQSIVSDVPKLAGLRRIVSLAVSYSMKTGYVCELVVTDEKDGTRSKAATPAGKVVDEFNKKLLAARQDHPAVDVGEVSAYTAGSGAASGEAHRVTLGYSQAPEKDVKAPSVDSPVSTEDVLVKKPVAAVFAFDKVGLVTPVYPGMRALLAHNRSLTNDAVVAGWLWPTKPTASSPPPNEPGDWWLALPTGLGSDGRPTGKGVNDLTDAHGARVIQARALHIVVGADALPDVGTRPTVPADDTITIEHAKGATITIDADGAVSVTTKQKKITLGNGQVTLALDGAAVKVE